MNAIILLFAVGIILLAFEVFVPGGILGIFGGLSLLGGIVLSFANFGATGGWTAVAIALGLVGLMVYIEFGLLPKTTLGRRLFLRSAVSGTSQPPLAESAAVVGREGETLTPLAPTGYVVVDGRRYEAFSQSGLLPKGAPVRVVGLDTFRLIVTKT